RVDLSAHRAQAGAVEVGEVDEVGALDGGPGREVDVVADQHRCPGRPRLVEPATTVGEHDRAATGGGRGADRVDDGGDALALVVVGAAAEEQQPAPAR